MKIEFTKNLKFRLAVLYSVILFIFSAIIILTFNIYIDRYLATKTDGSKIPPPPQETQEFYTKPFNQSRITEDPQKIISEERFNSLKNIQTISLFSLLPLAIVSFALGYFLSGRFLYPLNNLNKRIEKLKTENLGLQIEKKSDDEIGRLIKSFNDMSRRLKESFDAQSEFVQDAAHELKTPLTIVQTNLETVLVKKEPSIKDYDKAVKRSLEGMERLNLLTENLLTLTIPSSKNLQKTNLIPIIKEQINNLCKLVKNNNIKIESDLPNKQVIAFVDEHSIGRAIFNIIENAIKFSETDNNPEVKVAIALKDKFVQLKVANNGAKIPVSKRDKIFERFFRLDKSRSSNAGGYGLGLAIVKKIVDENQGKIYVDSDEIYTSFIIELKKA